MKGFKLLIFLIAIQLFSACRSDEFSETPGSDLISMDIPTSVTGNLNGLIVDENQQAISDAIVELNGITTISDENGVFSLDNAIALSTGSLVKVNKDGYYDGFKFTSFEPGQNSILKVQMVSKEIISTFQNSAETTINVNGAQLYLPANITVRADGSPYNGLVSVKAHWYDPADENTITEMPGDLRGIDATGLAVQLTTYGMMAVEITGTSGEELQLKEGMNATMTFPLPQNANGPDQIPMWHLDEDTGVWIEEGIATKIGSSMVAEVSHFSFWNCDDPFDVINIKGRVISNPGNIPVVGFQVIITDNNQMISGYGYTNNQGVFSGAVPLGNDLTMSIFNCGELIAFSSIGILTENTDLGDILVEIEDQLVLTATIVDCDGALVDEGIGLISTSNSLDIAVANNGQISHIMFPCDAGVGTFQAYYNTTAVVSEEISFDLEESFVNLEEVGVCDGTLAEEITFSFQNGPAVTLTDVTVSIVDDTYLHIYAEEAGSSPLNFIQLRYYLDGVPHSMGFQNQIYLGGELNNTTANDYTISDPNATWNNVSGLQVGDSVFGILDNHPTVDVTVVYNLKIDQIIKTATVTGNIWVDSDEDGIRETEETDSVPDGIEIYVWTDDPGFKSYYQFFQVDSDGSYSLKGLAEGKEYKLNALLFTSGFQATAYQQGNDSTIDNDFEIGIGVFDFIPDSAPFTLGSEEILSNMGLGIK